jgi:hypothetical protein
MSTPLCEKKYFSVSVGGLASCLRPFGHEGVHSYFADDEPEGVAAPLEPTAPKYDDSDEAWWNVAAKRIAKLQHMGIERGLELRETKIWDIIRQEAAAVSKNLREELVRIIDPIFDEGGQHWTLEEKLEAIASRDLRTICRLDELEKSESESEARILELEKEITALREKP